MNAKAQRRNGREAAGAKRSATAAKPSDLVSSKVLKLSNVLRRASTLAHRRNLGLSQVEWRMIALVGENAPVSLNELSDLTDLDRGQTSRAVSTLVSRRLMLREHRREGRGIRITLSTRGKESYARLMASALERNRLLLQSMNDLEKEQLFVLLDRLTTVARKILAREQRA